MSKIPHNEQRPEICYILNVVNKQLPPQDYRVRYPSFSSIPGLRCRFAMPGRPETVDTDDFVRMGFGEGVGLSDILHFLALYRDLAANRRRYRAVHFFSTKLHLFGPVIAWFAGVPSIVTITGFGRVFSRPEWYYRPLRLLYLALLKTAGRLSHAVLMQNRGDMERLRTILPALAPKLRWIGSGMDYPVHRREAMSEKPLGILLIARLLPQKGISLFIELALRFRDADVAFTLAGPASKGQRTLHHEVLNAHRTGLINYMGEVSFHDLLEVYDRHHIFLFPSTYGEGMPRVMMEAGYRGLCPLASDIPANKDIVIGGTGFVFTVGRPGVADELEALIRELDANRDMLAACASRFQEHILTAYTIEAYAKRVDRILTEGGLAVRP